MTTELKHGLFSAKILRDSVSPVGARLVSAELVFPRFILSEFNTHRAISKNSASSRAIPVKKQLQKLLNTPYVPERIGINQSGMQASKYMEGEQLLIAQENMLRKRDRSFIGALEDLVGRNFVRDQFGRNDYSRALTDGLIVDDHKVIERIFTYYDTTIDRMKNDPKYVAPVEFLNMHKQTINRYLEPFLMHTVVMTGTDFENLFALRVHSDAQDEIRIPVELLQQAMEASTPELVQAGEWHLPLVQSDEIEASKLDPKKWKYISVGRCARTSYETHDGVRDIEKDFELASTRLDPHGHMSPFEHVATPLDNPNEYSGNFRGWKQFRKELPYEANYAEKLSTLEV